MPLMTPCSVGGGACHHSREIPQNTKGNEELDMEARLKVRRCEKVALPLLGKGLRCLEMLHSPNRVGVMATERLSLNKGVVILVMSQVNWISRVTTRHSSLSLISDLFTHAGFGMSWLTEWFLIRLLVASISDLLRDPV